MLNRIVIVISLLFFTFTCSGCAIFKKSTKIDDLNEEIIGLKRKLAQCNEQKNKEVTSLDQANEQLRRSLESEIGQYKAKLAMTDRGLVITFLAEVFFSSGKDVIKEVAKPSLQKVAKVLQENVSGSNIAIEGHTDNQPIKYSGWKSNWELSSARALAVLHYFIDECNITPARLSANGYGEYRIVASNDTDSGRQQNRRVEIIILPEKIEKVKAK